MAVFSRKLREKLAVELKSSESASDERKKTGSRALTGVIVWADRLPRPGCEKLRCMIGEHGGFFEAYPAGRAAYIVAESLTAAAALRSKKKESGRRKARAAAPKWVVESAEKGRRLPEAEFSVKGMIDSN